MALCDNKSGHCTPPGKVVRLVVSENRGKNRGKNTKKSCPDLPDLIHVFPQFCNANTLVNYLHPSYTILRRKRKRNITKITVVHNDQVIILRTRYVPITNMFVLGQSCPICKRVYGQDIIDKQFHMFKID